MPNENQRPLGDVIKQMLRYYKLRQGLDEVTINTIWEKNMSPMIVRHTKNIFFYKETLFVELDSPALRQELSYGKEKIRDMMNKGLEKQMIEKVIIR
ncbi:MAG: DUF721 domain-containing protein [Bacteroidales bacterium]